MLKGITLVIFATYLAYVRSGQGFKPGRSACRLYQQLTDRKPDKDGTFVCLTGAIQDNLCRSGAPQHAAFSGFCLQRGHIDADS